MNQRLRVLDELGKEFERVLAGGQRTPRRAGAAAIAASAAVVVAVVLGAALLLRPAHHQPAATASKQALLSQFGVLRRPQTAADRAEAAAPPNLNRGMSVGGGQGASGAKSRHYTVRITGLAQYLDVPDLTRVVRVGGVSVTLFVERLIPSHT